MPGGVYDERFEEVDGARRAVDTFLTVRRLHGTMLTMKRVRKVLSERVRDDRGDVPGWVLITIMTAGLVILLWAAAGPALSSVFEQAIERVSGF